MRIAGRLPAVKRRYFCNGPSDLVRLHQDSVLSKTLQASIWDIIGMRSSSLRRSPFRQQPCRTIWAYGFATRGGELCIIYCSDRVAGEAPPADF
jgi:hypothetical protein